MTTAPLLSVVVAAHNGAAFLGQTLDSVLAQGQGPVQLIVVDDGSTDDTAAILAGYGSQLQVLHQTNRGVSAARNRGAELATAPLLAFLDQDDLWEPDLVARRLAAFQQRPSLGLAYGDSWVIDAAGSIQGRRRDWLRYREGWVHDDLLRGNFIPIETAVMPTALFRELGGFDERLRLVEDFELHLRVAADHPVGFDPEPGARYRIHDRNLSRDMEPLLAEYVEVLERLERATLTQGPRRRILRAEVARRAAEVAWHALRRGDLAAADRWIERAGWRCPAALSARVRLIRGLLGVLPGPLSRAALGLLPRRRLYGL